MLTKQQILILVFFQLGVASCFAEDQNNGAREVVQKPGQFDDESRRAQRLSDELKSPFCPGKTLKTCTSPNAAKVRREIQDMVSQGLTDSQIVEALKRTYDKDDFSVANPEQPGLTIFVPFLPFVILSGAMLWFVRYWRRSPESADGTTRPVESTERQDQREALRQRLNEEERET